MNWSTLPIAMMVAASVPAWTQGAGLPDRPIRRAEIADLVKSQFGRLDTNHDGVIDRAEFDSYRAKRDAARSRGESVEDQGFARIGGKWFERGDQNGDGKVTRAEAEVRPLRLFDMADANHDGIVSEQERKLALLLAGK